MQKKKTIENIITIVKVVQKLRKVLQNSGFDTIYNPLLKRFFLECIPTI